MATFELVLLLLAAVLISAVLDQFIPKVTLPLIQIAAGVIIALFAKDYIKITLDPNLFIVLFVAPLLYYDARALDKGALWHNKRPVLSLAIGLVFVTALAVGFLVNSIIPVIPLTAAVALGAALAPTDAVAVTSLAKDLSISNREQSILEGESLINDASGLVAFQFAIAACITGEFSLISATGSFIVSFFGGIAIGALMGFLTNYISKTAREAGVDSTTFHVLFDLFTPFIIYLAANAFGASGVIAVVAAGLVSGVGKRELGPSVSRTNIVSSSVWSVFSFALNGFVFVLLGTQLPKAMISTWENYTLDNGFLIVIILVIVLAIEVIRFLWLFGSEAYSAHRAKKPLALKAALKTSLVMTLAGAKGTLTLAIVFSIPWFNAAGDVFPQRELIIFLACGVILITLLIANFVIPLLAGKKEPSESDLQRHEDEAAAKIEVLRNVIEELARNHDPKERRAVHAAIRSYNERINRIKTDSSDEEDPEKTKLRLQIISWEREYVKDALENKDVDESAAYSVLSTLNRREKLIKHSENMFMGPTELSVRLNQLRFFIRSMAHRVINGLPLVSVPDEAATRHELVAKSTRYANKKLRELLKNSGDIPTEYVSELLIETSQLAASMEPKRPSITTMTALDDVTNDIIRRGLSIELEGIREMYEAGRISRTTAKRMRENVALMQIDLEDKV